MEYPEYVLPQDQAERETIKQDIIRFVSERCRLTQEEISSYISNTIQPKLDGTYQNPYGRQLNINFDNTEIPTFQLNSKAHFAIKNMLAIQQILSENNQFAPQFFSEKLRKLHKHNLGYGTIRSTRQLSSVFNFIDRIDYTTFMKRLLLESGQTHNTYQRKTIIDKLILDLNKSNGKNEISESLQKLRREIQRKQLLAKKIELEKELMRIEGELESNLNM